MKTWARGWWVSGRWVAGWLVRVRWLVAALGFLGGTCSWGACGDTPGVVRDWGLHREWRVVTDCAHPERPARLEETRWSLSAARADGSGRENIRPAARRVLVEAGMAVTVWRRDAEGEVRLTGVALGAGSQGDAVWVKAGLHGALLRAIVRGPAWVELAGGD